MSSLSPLIYFQRNRRHHLEEWSAAADSGANQGLQRGQAGAQVSCWAARWGWSEGWPHEYFRYNGSEITLRDVQPRDEGEYSCQLNSIQTPIELRHNLEVLSKLTLPSLNVFTYIIQGVHKKVLPVYTFPQLKSWFLDSFSKKEFITMHCMWSLNIKDSYLVSILSISLPLFLLSSSRQAFPTN